MTKNDFKEMIGGELIKANNAMQLPTRHRDVRKSTNFAGSVNAAFVRLLFTEFQ